MSASTAAVKDIGEQLLATSNGSGDTHLHFDEAVFHGISDQVYVSQIMDSAMASAEELIAHLGVQPDRAVSRSSEGFVPKRKFSL
jgi:hypothetical protein